VYQYPGLRQPGTDIDLLVKREEFLRAREALLSQGYELQAYRFELLKDFQYEEVFYHPQRGKGKWVIEIHWDLHVGCGSARRETVDHLFDRAVEVNTPSMSFRTLNPVDALISGALHMVFSHPYETQLRWVIDTACLAKSLSVPHDWNQLKERCGRWGGRIAVEYALRLAQNWTGLSLPQGFNDFSTWPQADPGERISIDKAIRKKDRPDAMLKLYLETEASLLRRLGLILRLVFPPPGYIRKVHPPRRNCLMPLSYVAYWHTWTSRMVRRAKASSTQGTMAKNDAHSR
jgi:hypothetical protein